MRWPDIFFKSRKPKSPVAPPKDTPSKSSSKVPTISELEKSVEPSPLKVAADKTAVDSLRALKQSDTIRILGPKETAPSPAAKTTELSSASPVPAEPDASTTGTSSFRRRAKMTDVARILPKENSELPPTTSEVIPAPEKKSGSEADPPAAVVPAAFPVAVATGSVMEKKTEETPASSRTPDSESSDKSAAPTPAFEMKDVSPAAEPKAVEPPSNTSRHHESASFPTNPSTSLKDTTRVVLPDTIAAPAKSPSGNTEIEPVKPDIREKREFVLANGERILGHILSETAEAIYLDHHTLGVLTLPRTQIAKKPIEVILINGDRIVGDLIAETTECLYIRHASLGMLTVPHSQRSTRVVEVILKDGDRILGEVLAETDHFTVVRSATLGTVAVQHAQVAMLNRKVEQMQLRALPAPALDAPKND